MFGGIFLAYCKLTLYVPFFSRSLRVLSQPGGKSSISFGGGDDTPATEAPRKTNNRNQSNVFGGNEQAAPNNQPAAATAKVDNTPSPAAQAAAHKQRNQMGTNPITGEPQRSSTRVHKPPGGGSNITFG